jgi:hypothetical protein
VLLRLPELDFIDDREGKPVGIHYHVGRRPIAAFGNSDGDLQMLECALTQAPERGWIVVSMERDWKRVFRDP